MSNYIKPDDSNVKDIHTINWVNNITRLNATNMNTMTSSIESLKSFSVALNDSVAEGFNDVYDEIDTQLQTKQDNLTAGDGITIEDNVINAVADQNYSSTSSNAQSGKAVADAISTKEDKPDIVKYLSITMAYGEIDISDCKVTISGNVTIPNLIKGHPVTSIGDYAFSNCSKLTSITLPDSVTSIGPYAFWKCTNLTSTIIPDSVTIINTEVFSGCTRLTSITIPDSITSIEVGAFSDCTNLTDIYYTGTEEQWNQINILTDGNSALTNATKHYNQALATKEYVNDAISSGGTTDYKDLENKPSINGVELIGNKTTADLGIDSTQGVLEVVDDETLTLLKSPDSSSYIGLYNSGEILICPTGTINIDGNRIVNLETPINDGDAATKNYIDNNLSAKQDTLVSGNNIKTINGYDILHSGNLEIKTGTPELKEITTDRYIEISDIANTYGFKIVGEGTSTSTCSVYSSDAYTHLNFTISRSDKTVPITYEDGTTGEIDMFSRNYYSITYTKELSSIGGIEVSDLGLDDNGTINISYVDEVSQGDYNYDCYIVGQNVDDSNNPSLVVGLSYNTNLGAYISDDIQYLDISNGKILVILNSYSPVSIKYYEKTNPTKYNDNIKNSYGELSLQQTQDPGYTTLNTKVDNPNACEIDNSLLEPQLIGAYGTLATSFNGTSSAQGKRAFACNSSTIAKGSYSHASGVNSVALGSAAHAQGHTTTAAGQGSHSEGMSTVASGIGAHAQGTNCVAEGNASFAGGTSSSAKGLYSTALGNGVVAGYNNQIVLGKFNKNKGDTLFELGSGASDTDRNNAFEVYKDGHAEISKMGTTNLSVTTKQYVDETKEVINSRLEGIESHIEEVEGHIEEVGGYKTITEEKKVYLKDLSQKDLLSLTSRTSDNYIFYENILPQQHTQSGPGFSYTWLNSCTIGTSACTITAQSSELTNSSLVEDIYRYIRFKTPSVIEGDNTVLTLLDDTGTFNIVLDVDNIMPNIEYIIVYCVQGNTWNFENIFNWTSKTTINGSQVITGDMVVPNCYVMIHESQLNQTRGYLDASWYSNDQYSELETKIITLQREIDNIKQLFRDNGIEI